MCAFASCLVGSCQDFVYVEAQGCFPVKIFELQLVYGEKGNSDFRVGVEVAKRMQIFCLSSLGSLMWEVMLECFWFRFFFFRGLSPAEAEFNYLNTARTLELYGVELHYARVSLDELVL